MHDAGDGAPFKSRFEEQERRVSRHTAPKRLRNELHAIRQHVNPFAFLGTQHPIIAFSVRSSKSRGNFLPLLSFSIYSRYAAVVTIIERIIGFVPARRNNKEAGGWSPGLESL